MKKWTSISAPTIGSGILLILLLLCLVAGCEKQKPALVLGGGPPGSTFQNFAVELGALLGQKITGVRIKVKSSSGSLHNLTQVNRGKMAMALVNAEDAHFGHLGQLPGDLPATENVMALVRLFGSAAQLVVAESSPIRTPHDLKKSRIAIGNHGSGSALSAELFFRSLGIWTEITPIYENLTMSLAELSQWGVEAVWLLGGFPNEALQETNRKFPIRLIDLTEEVVLSGFFAAYPSYSLARIPAGTYKGQDLDIFTFQNSILWVANRKTDEEFIYQALKYLFSVQGLTHMRLALPVARDLDVKKGLRGIKIPLHPGAVRFLQEAWFPQTDP